MSNAEAYAAAISDPPRSVPRDLFRVSPFFPSGLDRQMGYFGSARYCLFYFDAGAEGVIWNDGRSYGFGCGAWRPFSEYVEPLARRNRILLGSSPISNVLVVDREENKAYFIPRRSAERLVADQPTFVEEGVG